MGKVDALYSPTDNTIAAGASQVGQICKENKLPYVTGEEGMCMAGGLFTLSINYEDLGYAAGEMAVKILKGEAKPEDMPIKHLSSKDLVVVKNDEMADAWASTSPLWTRSVMCGDVPSTSRRCRVIQYLSHRGERQRPAFALLVTDETKHPSAALLCIVTAIMENHVSTLS